MTQRRKSITKATTPDAPARFYCYRCGSAFSKLSGNFSVSRSPMYRGLGYLPVCIECVDALYDKYLGTLKDRRAAMRRICMMFDIYWNNDIFDMVEKQENVKSFVRTYIGKTNMNRYMGKSFDDTIEEEAAERMARLQARAAEIGFIDDSDDQEIIDNHIVEIPQSVIDFWGPGFDPEFYLELERRYKEWTDGVDTSAPNIRSLYKQICILEARINKSVASGDPVKDDMNMLNTVLGNLALKPSQQKDDTDTSLDKIPFGVGIGWCEQHKPISEPAPEFKDVDGIVHYITAWFYGHLAKMAGLKNIKSQIYDDEINKWTVERPRSAAEEDDDEYLYDILSQDGGASK